MSLDSIIELIATLVFGSVAVLGYREGIGALKQRLRYVEMRQEEHDRRIEHNRNNIHAMQNAQSELHKETATAIHELRDELKDLIAGLSNQVAGLQGGRRAYNFPKDPAS